MKKLILIIAIAASFCCFPQDTDEPVKIRYNLNPAVSNPLGADTERVFTIKGSPYLNEIHKEGTIINGSKKIKALLRYNAYSDRFQVLDKNKKKSFVLKSPNIKIILDGETYHLITYKESVKDKTLYYIPDNSNEKLKANNRLGYFSPLNSGLTMFYSKTFKRALKFKDVVHGYESFTPSTFTTEKLYYIERKNRPAVRIRLSKKDVLLALNDKYNEIRAYLKKNKLKAKTKEEVLQIISYYDTLD